MSRKRTHVVRLCHSLPPLEAEDTGEVVEEATQEEEEDQEDAKDSLEEPPEGHHVKGPMPML